MIMSYKNIFSNTINRQQTGGITMTELSRFQKDVEVAANALEMRAENEDAKEEHLVFCQTFWYFRNIDIRTFRRRRSLG